jgi:histidyl-tRNA synthetase
MIPDTEVLRIIVEVFKALDLQVTIKMNHRRILDGMFAVAGVPEDKLRAISSSIDKLDKAPWETVKHEMTGEKELPEEVADKIGQYVQHKGNLTEIVEFIKADADLIANEDIKQGIKDMELLTGYADAGGISDSISFDLSLARGLDYYTGMIAEVIYTPTEKPVGKKAKNDPSMLVGSLGAGGRYDGLVGIFGKNQIPCVGFSFGADRIFTILKAKQEREAIKPQNEIDVYVMAFGGKDFDGFMKERFAVCCQLWDGGIRASFTAKAKPRLPQQFKAAEAENVPLAVILGQDELAAGQVRIKVLGLPEDHPEKQGVLVEKVNLVAEIQKRLEGPAIPIR